MSISLSFALFSKLLYKELAYFADYRYIHVFRMFSCIMHLFYIHTYRWLYIHIYIHTCIHTYTHIHTYIHTCVNITVIYMCIYIYIHVCRLTTHMDVKGVIPQQLTPGF